MNRTITLAHGGGGDAMRDLIRRHILKKFDNPALRPLADSAYIRAAGRLAYTADSFVVNPVVFPGGDIGKLAVCGTVNDLAVMGARPLYMSVSFIIEEGLAFELFISIVDSIAAAARAAGVAIAAGDIKVVERGSCDRVFISASGIGALLAARELGPHRIRARDRIICSGDIGRHGFAVLSARQKLDFGRAITSDCAPLAGLLLPLITSGRAVKCMRDAPRGGLAAVLHEFCAASGRGITIDELSLPVTPGVRVAGELLGLDPLYSANEGCAVIVVRPDAERAVLGRLRRHPLGRRAQAIGTVVSSHKRVLLSTSLGTERILPMRDLEQLPRIC